MPPTFSVPDDLVVAHIAGGPAAMSRAVEGAEDDAAAGSAEVRSARIGSADAVIGLSASGRAPYVLAAIREAAGAGALTVSITNDQRSPLAQAVDVSIALLTGAEAVAGSTRMKAASAQKMALATISTAVMVKLGRVYGNLMVGVTATNEKLRARAVRMVALLAGQGEEEARRALEACEYGVKPAVIVLRRHCTPKEASDVLERCGGDLRRALS
jgi:N-acetylmuramic acid 6-phosphate etherase